MDANTLDYAMIDVSDEGQSESSSPPPYASSPGNTQPGYDTTWPLDTSSLKDKMELASSMSSMVQKGKQAWTIYGNIDVLRPYFDVEPYDVIKRLLASFIPLKPTSRQKVAKELYGPLMVVFTLIALLLFQMKSSSHIVQEGTLMGTAFGVSFTYWIGTSSFIWFIAFVCNTSLTFVQILSMVGYALFSHCIVILLTTMIHTSHDHMFFYLMWGIVCGLASLKMVSIVLSRTTGNTQRVIICSVVTALHMMYLVYLHFAYHQIVEELSEVLSDNQGQRKYVESIGKVTESLIPSVTDEALPIKHTTVAKAKQVLVTIATNMVASRNQTA